MKSAANAYLPVVHTSSPLADEMDVFNPSLSLVDRLCYLLHPIHCRFYALRVGVAPVGVLQELLRNSKVQSKSTNTCDNTLTISGGGTFSKQSTHRRWTWELLTRVMNTQWRWHILQTVINVLQNKQTNGSHMSYTQTNKRQSNKQTNDNQTS